MALKGVAELRRKLQQMGPAVRKELEEQVLKGAQEIAATARSMVPRKSGDLARSIGANLGDAPGTTATQALRGGKRSKAAQAELPNENAIYATAYAGNDKAYYAGWVEFGTAPHPQGGWAKGTKHPGTAAQPFFFPAVRLNKKRATSRIQRGITKAVKKAASS